ncbi:MAG: hypothetical protein WC763_05140 [Candidatus Paceibacterota bacterium]|jgi:hypothetical protein
MGKRGPQKGVKYPKTIEKELIRERIKEFVKEKLDGILEAAWDSAKGHWALDKSDADGTRVYEVPPNPKAIFGLIEHAAGKAPQSLDITSKGERMGNVTPGEILERIAKLKR